MGKTKSSHQWMQRHLNDVYVKKAQQDGYRSRAAYKLLEIQEKEQFIQSGMNVVDLGCAPGGWCQVVKQLVGKKGKVIGLDILAMPDIPDVTFIQGDFRENAPLQALEKVLNQSTLDLVISDMAPNISGMSVIDLPKSMYLCELALDFAKTYLKPGGHFITKIFQGEGFDAFISDCRQNFIQVKTRKPKASRAKSREVYIVARKRKIV